MRFLVACLWQGIHRVRMLSRSHSPPPSTTATIWSACHRALDGSNPRLAASFLRSLRDRRRNRRRSFSVSIPHSAQTPLSRLKTSSLRYPGSDLSLCSCTQYTEQNERRPFGTSSPHQRHSARPPGPRGNVRESTQPASGHVLFVLKELAFLFKLLGCVPAGRARTAGSGDIPEGGNDVLAVPIVISQAVISQAAWLSGPGSAISF